MNDISRTVGSGFSNASAQREAKVAKQGIWAANPIPPWEWRKQNN